jgi:hypothetical protein
MIFSIDWLLQKWLVQTLALDRNVVIVLKQLCFLVFKQDFMVLALIINIGQVFLFDLAGVWLS